MTGRPIKGWTIQATCPNCGGTLTHIADGVPSTTETRAVAQCTACRREWGVELHLFPLADIAPPGSRCRRRSTLPIPGLTHGIRASYNQGCGCDPCLAAARDYDRQRRKRAA